MEKRSHTKTNKKADENPRKWFYSENKMEAELYGTDVFPGTWNWKEHTQKQVEINPTLGLKATLKGQSSLLLGNDIKKTRLIIQSVVQFLFCFGL